MNSITLDYTVKKPRLWWTNGLGEPYLYDFSTTVSINGDEVTATDEIGLRSLKLVTEDDEYGRSLTFELNGKLGIYERS